MADKCPNLEKLQEKTGQNTEHLGVPVKDTACKNIDPYIASGIMDIGQGSSAMQQQLTSQGRPPLIFEKQRRPRRRGKRNNRRGKFPDKTTEEEMAVTNVESSVQPALHEQTEEPSNSLYDLPSSHSEENNTTGLKSDAKSTLVSEVIEKRRATKDERFAQSEDLPDLPTMEESTVLNEETMNINAATPSSLGFEGVKSELVLGNGIMQQPASKERIVRHGKSRRGRKNIGRRDKRTEGTDEYSGVQQHLQEEKKRAPTSSKKYVSLIFIRHRKPRRAVKNWRFNKKLPGKEEKSSERSEEAVNTSSTLRNTSTAIIIEDEVNVELASGTVQQGEVMTSHASSQTHPSRIFINNVKYPREGRNKGGRGTVPENIDDQQYSTAPVQTAMDPNALVFDPSIYSGHRKFCNRCGRFWRVVFVPRYCQPEPQFFQPAPQFYETAQQFYEPAQQLYHPSQELLQPAQELYQPDQQQYQPAQQMYQLAEELHQPTQDLHQPAQELYQALQQLCQPTYGPYFEYIYQLAYIQAYYRLLFGGVPIPQQGFIDNVMKFNLNQNLRHDAF